MTGRLVFVLFLLQLLVGCEEKLGVTLSVDESQDGECSFGYIDCFGEMFCHEGEIRLYMPKGGCGEESLCSELDASLACTSGVCGEVLCSDDEEYLNSLASISDSSWEWTGRLTVPENVGSFFDWELENSGDDYLRIESNEGAVVSHQAVEGTSNLVESVLTGEGTLIVASALFAQEHGLESLCDPDVDEECRISVVGMRIWWIELDVHIEGDWVGSWAFVAADLGDRGELSLAIRGNAIADDHFLYSESSGRFHLEYHSPLEP